MCPAWPLPISWTFLKGWERMVAEDLVSSAEAAPSGPPTELQGPAFGSSSVPLFLGLLSKWAQRTELL